MSMPRDCADRGVAGRVQRSTPDLLRNLRNTRVLVFHPKDADGELLAQQLERIGCQVITMWPPLADLPDSVDMVFCAVRPDHAALRCPWMEGEPPVPVIATPARVVAAAVEVVTLTARGTSNASAVTPALVVTDFT
jgi:AmiR/NasT family two-component response regulator